MKEYTRIVGIDVSLTATGWCEYDCLLGVLSHSVCPPFPTPHSQDESMRRLAHVLKFVKSKVDPDSFVVFEGFAFSQPNQAHQLGGIGYLLRFYLWQQGIDWMEIGPTKLKQFVTGKAFAKKEEMMKDVLKRFSVDTDDNNVADAVALAHVGMTKLGYYPNATQYQMECILPSVKKSKRKKKQKEAQPF